MKPSDTAGDCCTCPDPGPLCPWHRANLARLRRLYAVEYSDEVLEELTRPDAPAVEALEHTEAA